MPPLQCRGLRLAMGLVMSSKDDAPNLFISRDGSIRTQGERLDELSGRDLVPCSGFFVRQKVRCQRV